MVYWGNCAFYSFALFTDRLDINISFDGTTRDRFSKLVGKKVECAQYCEIMYVIYHNIIQQGSRRFHTYIYIYGTLY